MKADNVFSATSFKNKKRSIFLIKDKYTKPNGNFYITKLNFFLKKRNLFSGKSYGCIINDKHLLVDIDTLVDYREALTIFNKLKKKYKYL